MKLSNVGYIRNFVLAAFIFLLVVTGINVIVDPYGIFQTPTIPGFSELKPEFNVNLLRSKAAAVRHVKPEAVILGTSRADQGYNPEHPGFQAGVAPVYNLASPSSTMYRMYRMFQHANFNHPIQRIVLALDFLSFNIYQQDGNVDAFADVSYDGKPQPFAHWQGVIPATISFDALKSSLITVQSQNLEELNSLHLANGFHEKGGRESQARQYYLMNCARFVRSVYFPPPQKKYEFKDRKTQRSSFTYFRDLLSFAYQNQIDLRMSINPPHAYLMEVIAQSGLWDRYEEWKRTMVDINEEEAKKAKSEPFPLWDFSGYNSVSTQVIPTRKTKNTDEFYYYESSHFKEILGDMMMDKLFDYQDPNRVIPSDFGVRLTAESIEGHLAQIRADQAAYQRDHADEVRDVAKAIRGPLQQVKE
jgi:hypothetical protein